MNVSDMMTTQVHTLRPDMTVKDAAQVMVDRGVRGMPVVSHTGELVGMLSEADFIAPHTSIDRSRRLLRLLTGEEVETLVEAEFVEELMVREVVTIGEHEPLGAAGRLMATKRVKRLPVIDAQGNMVGIISRADLLRAFARSDQ